MCILLPPWVSSDRQKDTEAWVPFFLKHTDNPEPTKRNQPDKHCFLCKNTQEIPVVTSSGMCPGSRIQSTAKQCWRMEAGVPCTVTGRSPRQRDMERQFQWLQGTPLAQHLWKSNFLQITRKNLALGTFKGKRRAALFIGYINVCVNLALLWSPCTGWREAALAASSDAQYLSLSTCIPLLVLKIHLHKDAASYHDAWNHRLS